jgi:DNA-binding MarR family transcriptional regulator
MLEIFKGLTLQLSFRVTAKRAASSGSPAEEMVERVYDFMGAMGRWTETVLGDLNLTEALADVLWHLETPEKPISQRQLAGRLHCDPSNVTYLVDRLEERGLIKRRGDPSDRRVKIVGLTPAGLELRNEIVRAATTRSPLARLSREDQQQLHDLLAKTIGAERPGSPEGSDGATSATRPACRTRAPPRPSSSRPQPRWPRLDSRASQVVRSSPSTTAASRTTQVAVPATILA